MVVWCDTYLSWRLLGWYQPTCSLLQTLSTHGALRLFWHCCHVGGRGRSSAQSGAPSAVVQTHSTNERSSVHVYEGLYLPTGIIERIRVDSWPCTRGVVSTSRWSNLVIRACKRRFRITCNSFLYKPFKKKKLIMLCEKLMRLSLWICWNRIIFIFS